MYFLGLIHCSSQFSIFILEGKQRFWNPFAIPKKLSEPVFVETFVSLNFLSSNSLLKLNFVSLSAV